MNEYQRQYAAAKSLYESLNAEIATTMKTHDNLLGSEEGVEFYTEIWTDLEEKLGTRHASDALLAAESTMIAWALEAIKIHPSYSANAAEFDNLHQRALQFPHIYRKLVDICFHLSV